MTANIANIAQTFDLDPHHVEIRAVREEEIHCVADIITRSFHFDRGWMGWFTPLFKLGIAEDLRHRLRSNIVSGSSNGKQQQQVCSIAAYTDRGKSQVIGTIEVGMRTTNYRQPTPHRYVYISNLAVSRDFRRLGIAQGLLHDCERLTTAWGHTELYLHVMGNNDRGRRLYEKLGYEIVFRETVWSIVPWHRPERLFLCKQLD
ncbi:GNAT family N-acetyltransferase [Chamaesiphon sp. VAR_48_metabat_403]|uniref:GNAT family N-acetyltransferase n=1 Tax=Chamaesiphon sp. VAR_48_metabat_403 TaxID=2964700 RepID=UPI00286E19E9|nr:GNAT family N-acetyltransferase [Chamaesiphon sp. VAR_48_metabat_403]